MKEHPNVRLIRRGYDSFAAGDLDALRELVADTVVWHEPGRSPLGGDYKGREGIIELLTKLRELSDGTFSMKVIDVLATPERVVALHEDTARRAGRELDMSSAVEFEIHAGKITEVTVYHDDTYHFDEFWA
jgi:ketosteroid isomerase-like protein